MVEKVYGTSFLWRIKPAVPRYETAWWFARCCFLRLSYGIPGPRVIATSKTFLEGIIPGLDSEKYGIVLAGSRCPGNWMLFAGGLTDGWDAEGHRDCNRVLEAGGHASRRFPVSLAGRSAFPCFLLGLGEAENLSRVHEGRGRVVCPKRERALTPEFSLRSPISPHRGAAVVPLLVAVFSWRGAFW